MCGKHTQKTACYIWVTLKGKKHNKISYLNSQKRTSIKQKPCYLERTSEAVFGNFFHSEEGNTAKRSNEKSLFFVFDLLAVDCLLDLLHDGVDLSVASGVDGSALLLTGHATNMGSDVVEDSWESHINNISLTEG